MGYFAEKGLEEIFKILKKYRISLVMPVWAYLQLSCSENIPCLNPAKVDPTGSK